MSSLFVATAQKVVAADGCLADPDLLADLSGTMTLARELGNLRQQGILPLPAIG
ncbi:MAG: hypothetical protein WCJ35_16530 [Planctomycetota bacterium]